MPQLNLLKAGQPARYDVTVAVPFNPTERIALAASIRDFDGRLQSHWNARWPKDAETHDLGRLLVVGWEHFLYQDGWGLAETLDRTLRELSGVPRSARG